jgi:putative membrane protein
MNTTAPNLPRSKGPSEGVYLALNGIVSVVALAILTWILVLRSPASDAGQLAFMPAVNAVFNSISATCIVLGLIAIRRKQTNVHRALMLSALGSSALFLVGYLVYHYVHGDTHFPEGNALRPVYLILLLTHVVLSIVALPMVFWTFILAFRGEFARHKRFAKFTFPLWLYVSVTGVIVFLMLRTAVG